MDVLPNPRCLVDLTVSLPLCVAHQAWAASSGSCRSQQTPAGTIVVTLGMLRPRVSGVAAGLTDGAAPIPGR